MFDWIINIISNIGVTLSSFFSSVWSVLSYIRSMLKALWFWLISLISWVSQLLNQTLASDLLWNVAEQFVNIAKYIWVWPTIFIATLLFIIMFRIVVAFILKFFRMNIDYQEKSTKYHLFHK